MRNRFNRKTLFVAIIVLALLVNPCTLVFFYPGLVYRIERQVRQIPFDSVTWKSVRWATLSTGENRTRDFMLNDLLARYDFKGWQRDRILELLGQPTEEHPNFANNGLTYSWYRIDGLFDYLLLLYSSNGVVVSYRVSYD